MSALKRRDFENLVMDLSRPSPYMLEQRLKSLLDRTVDGVEAAPKLVGAGSESILKATEEVRKLYGGMPMNGAYKLGAASKKELVGVKAELVKCVELAIQLTIQDFTVYDGMRTLKEQQLHIANGTSKTLDSKHLKGLAVDLVPWINGRPVWDWDGCYKIAQAMDAAATHLGFANKITWGGAWDRRLSDFGDPVDWQTYETEVSAYHKRTGKSFVDGPHFEWLP